MLALWIATGAGWGVITRGLRHGLSGYARRYALIAHGLTPPGIILTFSILGFGSLYATIALAAEYWALIAATGLRPERLVQEGRQARLAAFLVITVAGTLAVRGLIV